MQNLCFKPRPGGKSVQLVRHVYDSSTKRSRTVTVGTLDLRADPANVPEGLALREGSTLDDNEHKKIIAYLLAHADPASCQKRDALAARIRQELRSNNCAVEVNPFDQCANDIVALTVALPSLANDARASGEDPWLTLRPRYLELAENWKALVMAAQATGIAKQYKRGGASTADEI